MASRFARPSATLWRGLLLACTVRLSDPSIPVQGTGAPDDPSRPSGHEMAKQRTRQGPGDREPSATTGDAPDATAGTDDTREPKAQRTPGANPQHVVQRRVSIVRAYLIAGYTTTEIRRKVAKAYQKEAPARKQHVEAVDVTDPEAIAELPALVWGEPGDELPSDRTIDRYIAKAKATLEEDGRTAARLGDRLFGIQLARLSESYRVAKQKRAPSAMVRVVEATNDLFAFDGAIRPSLTALTAGGDETPRTGDKAPPGDASMTADAALAEMQALLDVGRRRLQNQQQNQQQATPVTAPATIDAEAAP